MKPFTDIHVHLLYGMDDGARTREEMRELLRAEGENNVERVVVTPHMTPGVYPFDWEKYEERLKEAQEIGSQMTPPVTVYGGAEILYSTQTCAMLRNGRVPVMAGTGIVLVEFSPTIKYRDLYRAVSDLAETGFLPMLAHVERYRCLVQRPRCAVRMKREQPVLYQVNAGTFLQKQGLRQKWFMRVLAGKRLMDAVGTDAHNGSTRPVCIMDAYPAIRRLCGSRYAQVLTDGSILFGGGMRRD